MDPINKPSPYDSVWNTAREELKHGTKDPKHSQIAELFKELSYLNPSIDQNRIDQYINYRAEETLGKVWKEVARELPENENIVSVFKSRVKEKYGDDFSEDLDRVIELRSTGNKIIRQPFDEIIRKTEKLD